MADTWGGSWGASWALSWTRSSSPVEDERKHGGPAPRTYAPPHKKIKKKPGEDDRVVAAKELYAKALEIIPEKLQTGILPLEYQIRSKRVTTLPPARNVDFAKLANDAAVLNIMIAALRDAEIRKFTAVAKRRRDEEFILMKIIEELL